MATIKRVTIKENNSLKNTELPDFHKFSMPIICLEHCFNLYLYYGFSPVNMLHCGMVEKRKLQNVTDVWKSGEKL